jgi:hypothetical protein
MVTAVQNFTVRVGVPTFPVRGVPHVFVTPSIPRFTVGAIP